MKKIQAVGENQIWQEDDSTAAQMVSDCVCVCVCHL